MRTKISIFVLGVIFLSGCVVLSGCSLYRESLLEMSREDVKNAVAVREAATNFLSTWNINSGFIKGSLGPRIEQFPAQFIVAVDELDDLATKEDPLSDQELGYSLGLRVRTLEALIQSTLETYAADVLDLIPFPLKF